MPYERTPLIAFMEHALDSYRFSGLEILSLPCSYQEEPGDIGSRGAVGRIFYLQQPLRVEYIPIRGWDALRG